MNPPIGRAAVEKVFGSPRGANGPNPAWEAANLVMMDLPYAMRLAWSTGETVTRIQVHKLIVDPLRAALQGVYDEARVQVKRQLGFDRTTEWYDDETMKSLRGHGLDLFGGTFAYRAIRGASGLSMHSYGIAIDLNPNANRMGTAGNMPDWVVRAFESQGFVWGGTFARKDPMHFQMARGC